MQKSTWLIFFTLLGAMQSNAQSVESTFHSLVCPGIVNMTALEELIEIKIDEALSRRQATTQLPTTTERPTTGATETYSSCRGVKLALAKSRNETGGVFDIVIPGVGTKEVYCNTEIDGGGWIVFQRRMDGSVDFDRNWNDYVAGFGNTRGEYWLGLEAIYQLTKSGGVELRIDMIDLNRNYYYAKYSNFQIGPSSSNYRLTVSGFSGNVIDRFSYQNNQQFTTKDRDNDPDSTTQCSHFMNGAWWYKSCGLSSLNGVYGRTGHKGVFWNGQSNIRFTEMKLRKKM